MTGNQRKIMDQLLKTSNLPPQGVIELDASLNGVEGS